MSHELVHTSAPEGLNPGTRGYCTVLSTKGMPRVLTELLESLSGYRHAAQPPHPTNFQHVTTSVAGRRYHILSRVADCGADYTGRTNKLAHHLALSPDELVNGGPAWILSAQGLFLKTWTTDPQWKETGQTPPKGQHAPGSCGRWADVTGDAGWAGVLAEAAMSAGRPMSVIFEPRMDTLALVKEALALLPAARYWSTTFSTYFSTLPPGMECQWRFILEGTREAELLRHNAAASKIDLVSLSQSRQRAPNSAVVESVRSGRAPQWQGGAARATARKTESMPSSTAAAEAAVERDLGTGQSLADWANATYHPAASQTALPPALQDHVGGAEKPKWLPVAKIAGGLLLLGIFVVMLTVVLKSLFVKPVPVIAKKEQQTQVKLEQKSRKRFAPEKEEKEEAPNSSIRRVPKGMPGKETSPGVPEDTLAKPQKAPDPEWYKLAWNEDIKTNGGFAPLPTPPSQTSAVEPPLEEIIRIHVRNPGDCQLALASAEEASEDGQGLHLKADEYGGGPSRTWRVVRVSINRLSATAPRRETTIGKFQLDQNVLKFQWQANAPGWASPQALKYSLLKITVKDEFKECRLFKPEPSEDARLGLDRSRTHKADVGISSQAVDDPKQLMLDLAFSGFPKKLPPISGMRIGEAKIIRIEGTKQHGDETVEIEIAFLTDAQKAPFLQFEAFINAKEISPLPAEIDKIITLARAPGLELSNSALQKFGDELRKISVEEIRLAKPVFVEDFDAIKKNLRPIKFKIKRLCEAVSIQFVKAQNRSVPQSDSEQDRKIRDARKTALQKFRSVADGLFTIYSDLEQNAGNWCDAMERRFEDIQEKAVIAYAVYVEVAGQRVYLARSESFPQKMLQK